ncbi:MULTISPECIES: phosphoribosylamine--glycine ligase [unclassified Granulicatella]|uniref:phosphoribosylamine--glycine ligase n=1 Tax=unclassified Granulicatella TaxID=2630493 RepID=UPI0010735E86|nr:MULTISPECIES: phosphoribosylamine--glycine ligase [unclassified Granulicatella]MBF0779784.1 phosphoribosylamine--glycine ligase [Granulicatella sp. 19428wC4_WM01]TFU96186.1 phosphoribosylamine--glycine ligase [Granulicatella sp. WM01]
MNILVVGSGGREHAIAKTLANSPVTKHVFCAKGNPRMVQDGIELVDISEIDGESLVQFAKEQQIDWTFIGPELPLFHGVSDAFEQAGLRVFSPSKAAAKIEYSKDFAKQLMVKYHVPTAKSATFSSFDLAKDYVLEHGAPIVIKADGLAAGKGVVVAMNTDEALEALSFMLLDGAYANQDDVAKVVIEEYLEGEEFSLFSFVNGEKAYFAGISQDHKRAYDHDLGPNTGGMGAYSPVPQFSQEVIDECMAQVVYPIIKGMKQEGCAYKGVLYAGLMMTKGGVKVIEFNARFGDPETQVVLQRLNSDLATIIDDILQDKEPVIEWKQNSITLGVVVAAKGYPSQYEKGFSLGKLTPRDSEQVQLFAAGVNGNQGEYIANGGRLFLVSATEETAHKAQKVVYDYLQEHTIEGTFYRHDIGYHVVNWEKKYSE